ncbi:translationally-controlled tumor protein homolog [Petaurus breviceps papuanus]|uniref:translationally-controlled tumor protein homolog n=1 Tax=Petaurus breviceps papuanus TaxID=3040969 RepID=UPI0036D85DC8
MIIHWNLISHDEMFSDIYKNGLCLEVEGKMVSRTGGTIDNSLIGGNTSAEVPKGKGMDAIVIIAVDIVINHHLQETIRTKESYKKYIRNYMKGLKGRLEEHKPDRMKHFMTGAAEQIKHILANFKNYKFFLGKNMNSDGVVALLDFCEDVVISYIIFFKDDLEMEKCEQIQLITLNHLSSLLAAAFCHLHNTRTCTSLDQCHLEGSPNQSRLQDSESPAAVVVFRLVNPKTPTCK